MAMIYGTSTPSLARLAHSIVEDAYSSTINSYAYMTDITDENGNTFDIYEVSVAKSIFGYVSIIHDDKYTKRQNNNRVVKVVMNNMGFDNLNDYINVYPGRYHLNTINRELSLSKSAKLFKVYAICDEYFFNNMTHLDLIEYNTLVAYPLLHDTMHCEYFRTIDKKDLWFCKDWNDDDGSVSL